MKRVLFGLPALLLTACSGGIGQLLAPEPTATPTPQPTATPTPMPDFRELGVEEIIEIYEADFEFFSGNLGWIGASEDKCLGMVIYTDQGEVDGAVIEMALVIRDEEIDSSETICDDEGRIAYVEDMLQTWTSGRAAMWAVAQLNDENQFGQTGEAHSTRYVRENNYHIFALNVDPIGVEMGG